MKKGSYISKPRIRISILIIFALLAVPAAAYCPDPDVTGDCDVNMKDLVRLAGQWLDQGSFDPLVPTDFSPCAFTLDPNDLVLGNPASVDQFYDATIDYYFCLLAALLQYEYDYRVMSSPVDYKTALAPYKDLALESLDIMKSILKEESTYLPPEIPPLVVSDAVKADFVTIQWGWPKNPFKKELDKIMDAVEDVGNAVIGVVNDGLDQAAQGVEEIGKTAKEWYKKGEEIVDEHIDVVQGSLERGARRVLDNTSEGQLVKAAWENAEDTYNETKSVIDAAK